MENEGVIVRRLWPGDGMLSSDNDCDDGDVGADDAEWDD